MDNFSKFLVNGEDLKIVCKSKKRSIRVYFIVFLFLLAFFMLFPMWKAGYHGFVLWLFWIIFLIFLLSKELISQNNLYLLTNKRIIHIKAISKTSYKMIGFIKISNIKKTYKKRNNICIISKNKKYYLDSIDLVDKLYTKLNSYIKD